MTKIFVNKVALIGMLAAFVALCTVGSPARAGGLSITVFDGENFSGDSRTFSNGVSNLASFGFNDRISSVIVQSGSWRLCDQANLSAPCVTLNPGRYPQLSRWGLNDKVSSLAPIGWNGAGGSPNGNGGNPNWNNGNGNNGWVGPGGQGDVMLFEDDDFRGAIRNVSGPVRDLSTLGFNDKTSSLVINRGRWLLCDQGDYKPPCINLGPGRYRRLADYGLNDAISSLRPI